MSRAQKLEIIRETVEALATLAAPASEVELAKARLGLERALDGLEGLEPDTDIRGASTCFIWDEDLYKLARQIEIARQWLYNHCYTLPMSHDLGFNAIILGPGSRQLAGAKFYGLPLVSPEPGALIPVLAWPAHLGGSYEAV